MYHTHSYVDTLPFSFKVFPSQEMTPTPTYLIKPKSKEFWFLSLTA